MSIKKKLLIVLGVLLALVPIGLLTSAPAYGEWDTSYYKKVLGFVPEGAVKLQNMLEFKHFLPDYSLPGANDVVGYYVSAIVGAILVFALYYLVYLAIKGKKNCES
jgi:hypothetical protein